MTGWWLKAQGELRFAEPAHIAILSNFTGSDQKDYCGFTTHAYHAYMWCNGDLERIAASQKDQLVNCWFNGTTFWKNP